MLSRSQLAQSLGVGASAIPGMVKRSLLPAPRQNGGHLFWIVSEVEQAIREWPISMAFGPGFVATTDPTEDEILGRELAEFGRKLSAKQIRG